MKLALPAMVLGGSVVGFQAMRDGRGDRPSFERREEAAPVTTRLVAFEDVAPEIELFGELVASQTVELRAPVPGEVVEVHPGLVDGGIVPAGETVIAVDPFDYEGAVVQARANLAEARARVSEVDSRIALEQTLADGAEQQRAIVADEVERFEALAERGTSTQAQVDAKRLDLSTRAQAVEQRRANIVIETARLDQARAQVDRLAWMLEVAERDLQRTRLTVPFDGVVREANAEIGKRLNANDIVAVLYDPGSLEVRVALPDALYGRLLGDGSVIGRAVGISWRLGRDVRRATGEVVRVSADIAAERGGVDVYVRVADADPSLRPGAFLEVSMRDVTYSGVLVVPEAALYDGERIYTIADDRLVGHDVELVAFVAEGFLVRTDAPVGAPLMTSRMTEAGDGVLVRDVDAPADAEASPSEAEVSATGDQRAPPTGTSTGANARERR